MIILEKKYCKECKQELFVNKHCINSWCEDYDEEKDKEKQAWDEHKQTSGIMEKIRKKHNVKVVGGSNISYEPADRKDYINYIVGED